MSNTQPIQGHTVYNNFANNIKLNEEAKQNSLLQKY